MFTKLLSVSASLILSVAGIASGADTMPTKSTVRLFRQAQPQRLMCPSSMVVSSWIISLRRRRKPTVLAIYPDQPDPVYRKRPRRRAKL